MPSMSTPTAMWADLLRTGVLPVIYLDALVVKVRNGTQEPVADSHSDQRLTCNHRITW